MRISLLGPFVSPVESHERRSSGSARGIACEHVDHDCKGKDCRENGDDVDIDNENEEDYSNGSRDDGGSAWSPHERP